MAELFSLKKGARLPSQTWTLTASATFDLTTATAVKFVYRLKGVAERVEVTLTVLTATTVRLDPPVGVSDSIGTHECQVEATIGGLRLDFPNEGFDTFRITPSIDA